MSSCREEAALIKKAREINDAKPVWVVNKVFNAINILLLEDPDRDINQITIACYGLSFKKNIDDLRESPALAIVSELYERHPGPIKIIEPNLRVLPSHFGNCELHPCTEKMPDADIHLMLVDHDEFVRSEVPRGLLIDTRGIWS